MTGARSFYAVTFTRNGKPERAYILARNAQDATSRAVQHYTSEGCTLDAITEVNKT